MTWDAIFSPIARHAAAAGEGAFSHKRNTVSISPQESHLSAGRERGSWAGEVLGSLEREASHLTLQPDFDTERLK